MFFTYPIARIVSGRFLIALTFMAISLQLLASSGQPFTPSRYGFIENKGQIVDQNRESNAAVLYLYNAGGLNVQLKANGFSYEVIHKEQKARSLPFQKAPLAENPASIQPADITYKVHRVDITLVGAAAHPQIIPTHRANDYLNFYTPGTSENGALNVRHYKRVLYTDIYPNIDLEFVLGDAGFKYNFIVRPGGNVNDIKLQLDGADATSLTENGDISIVTAYGNIDERIPYSYQLNDQNRDQAVNVAFKKLNDNTYGFDAKQYDQAKALVIDPSPWANYIGSFEGDYARGIETDINGNVVSTGYILSYSNIATAGSHQSTIAGGEEAFVIKHSSSGTRLWATYYGGSYADFGTGIDTDPSGNIVMTGYTSSSAGIATAGSYLSTKPYANGYLDFDVFIVKFNASGVRQWGTYFGGSGENDKANAVACSNNGNIAITGSTDSPTGTGIATSGTFQTSKGSYQDGFIAYFSSTGSLQWSTYFGGSDNDEGNDIAFYNDYANESIVVSGTTGSAGLGTTGVFQPTFGGGTDMFITMFTSSGALSWTTYYGGTGYDANPHIAFDSNARINLIGTTNSTGMGDGVSSPSTPLGGFDAVYANLNVSANRLWSYYVGGPGNDKAYDIDVDASNNVFIAGTTNSTSNIASFGSLQSTIGGLTDGFVMKSPSGFGVSWGTYYGGTDNDIIYGVAAKDGTPFISGYSVSSSIPMATTVNQGYEDVFVAGLHHLGVWVPITGNTITGNASICQNSVSTITGSTPSGGNNAYTYSWVSSTTGSTSGYSAAAGSNNGMHYTTAPLSINTWFRRVTISDGDADTSAAVLISILPNPVPVAGFTLSENTAQCLNGNSYTLTDTSFISSGTLTRTWKFGDNTTSASSNLVKTYTQAGNYTIWLISSNSIGCKDSVSRSISIRPKPSIVFTINNDTQCINGNSFVFNDVSTISPGVLTSRLWELGEADTSTLSNPAKTYSSPGLYTIKLVGESDFGCRDSITKTVRVAPQPVADFSMSNDSQCLNGNSFALTDLSSVTVGTYNRAWKYGDGNTSALTNPTKTYAASGNYTIKLISTTNFGCKDSVSKDVVVFPKPVVAFTIDNDTQCFNGNSFAFNDLSTVSSGSIQRIWTLGNGDTSTTGSPQKSFIASGLFNIKLVQETDWGCKDSLTKKALVNPSQTIDFTISNDTQCLNGNSFAFNDISSVSLGTLTRSWQFGDGNLSSLINPVKSYANDGSYTVKMVSTTNMGCKDSVTKQVTLFPKPVLAFTIDNDTQCFAGNSFVFNDLSSVNAGSIQRLWTLGNGDTSTSVSPLKSFASAGLFPIKLLQETDLGCKDSLTKPVLVNPTQTIDFSINNDNQCVNGNSFVFTDLSSVSSGSLQRTWKFGDGTTSTLLSPTKSYSAAGTYTITMVSSTNMGCTDSVAQTVVVHPKPQVTFTINNDSQCFEGHSFTFNDLSTLNAGTMQRLWSMGDGDTSSASNPVKSYITAGLFPVKLLLKSDNGCKDSLIQQVLVKPEPVVDFSISNDSQCFAGNSFAFNDQSTVSTGTLTRSWSFGNGTNATSLASTVSYAAAGSYTVNMISVTNLGCSDSVSKEVIVHPQPEVHLTVNDNTQCFAGNDFTFTDNSLVSSGTLSSYWILGEMDNASTTSVQKSFATAGAYTVKLISTTGFGCIDSVTENISVYPQPVVDFSINNDAQCLSGNGFAFTNTSSIGTGSMQYQWSLGEGDTTSTVDASKSFATPGAFDVKVTAVSDMGCVDSVSKPITVYPQPVVDFSINIPAQCLSGNGFVFTDLSSVTAGTLSSAWTLGDDDTSSAINVSKSYTLDGSYDVTLISTTDMGCNETITKTVTVYPQPSVDFTIDNDSQCFAGNSFMFSDISSVSTGSLNRTWTFGDADSSSTSTPTKSYLTAGSYTVKMISHTDMGCQDSLSKTIVVHPQPVANFSVNNAAQCLSGNSFAFSDISSVSTGTTTSAWSMGDGNTSTLTNPVNAYAAAGSYDVKLVSTTDMGCADSLTNTITVHPQPTVSFTIDNDSQCFAGNSFVLTDFSTVSTGTLQLAWDLGDGSTASAAGVTQSYSSAGLYTIKLTASTDMGCTDSANAAISVHPQPAVDFSINDDEQCLSGNQFDFSDLSSVTTGTLQRIWDLGNGNTSSVANPSNTYATANTYTVKLVSFTDMGCTDSLTQAITVNPQPAVDFTINDDMQCLDGNSFALNDISTISSGTLSSTWAFGDGDSSSLINPTKTYDDANSYAVILISATDKGCIDSASKTVIVHPMPVVDFSIDNDSQCFTGNSFAFNDISTVSTGSIVKHKWDLGNGDTSISAGLAKTYATAAAYPVTLVSETDKGCSNTVIKNIVVHPQPSVDFSINNDSQCFAGNSFVLNDLSSISTGSITRVWLFGDGNTSTAQTPAKAFAAAGSFENQLVISSAFGCKDTLRKTVVVHPQPVALFTTSNDSQCVAGNSFAFTDNSSIAEGTLTRSWNFGDNNVAADSTPVHTYAQAGSFAVTLTNVSAFGCSDSITQPVVVHALPSVQLVGPNNGLICQGSSFTLNTVAPDVVSYVWKKDGVIIPSATGASFTSDSTGVYDVVVSSVFACNNSASTHINFSSNNIVQPICLVTVDSTTGKNVVVWERVNKPAQTTYLVYKETNISNIYNLIGSVPADSIGLFADTSSAPDVKADRYKISSLDTCGNESVKSAAHKTMHLNINAGLGNSWNLIWESYEGNPVNTINIYRGTSASNLTLLTSVQGSINSYTDLTPPSGSVYYMVTVDFGTSCDPSVLRKTAFSTTQSNIVSHIGTGVAEASVIGNISVFPNPSATGIFTLANEYSKTLSVKLFDVNGKLVDEQAHISAQATQLDYSTLKDGVYLLQVTSGDKIQHIRLVIAK